MSDQRSALEVRRRRAAHDRFPDDPKRAERWRLIMHYAVQGFSQDAIAKALEFQFPGERITQQMVSVELKDILDWQRKETEKNALSVYSQIDNQLERLAQESWRMFYDARQSRREPLDPLTGQPWRLDLATGKTADGRTPEIIPAAPYPVQTAIVQTIQKLLTARSIHRFGTKGGTTINVNQNTDNRKLSVNVSGPVRDSLALRDQMEQIQASLRDEQLNAPTPPRQHTEVVEVQSRPRELSELQREVDNVAKQADREQEAAQWE